MKHILINIAAALFLLCPSLHATEFCEGDSPVVVILDSNKETKTLDGAKLKIARPVLKRTPMGVILDEITMLAICPLELNPQGGDFKFTRQAE